MNELERVKAPSRRAAGRQAQRWERKQEQTARKALAAFLSGLDRQYLELLDELARRPRSPEQVHAFSGGALQLSQMSAAVASWLEAGQPVEPGQARQRVVELAGELLDCLGQPWDTDFALRKAWLQTLEMANTAIERLERAGAGGQPLPGPAQSPAAQAGPARLVVPAELLFQAFQALFPAERMLVGSGRRMESRRVTLGAVFDVTGQANSGHVRADPDRLAQALMAMEKAGTFLACWLHSHPGQGALATHPSQIDLAQHQDWLQNYSAELVSAILVEEGWIRFWGSSLEEGAVVVEILGSGVEKMEAEDEWIYRFCRG